MILPKTYVISLLEREDRRKHVDKQMEEYLPNLDWDYWDAIKDENGATGLKKTFLEIFDWFLFKNTDSNWIWIMEDDFKIISAANYFKIKLEDGLKELPKDFDLFHLGCNLLCPAEKYSNNLLKIRGAYAAHSIIYSRKAIEKIWLNLKSPLNVELAYDQILAKYIHPSGKSFCSYPMLITQEPFTSNIASFDEYAKNPMAQKYLDYEDKIIRWDLFMEDMFEKNTKHLK